MEELFHIHFPYFQYIFLGLFGQERLYWAEGKSVDAVSGRVLFPY